MKHWFGNLAERERRTLLIGASAVVSALLYVMVLSPLDARLNGARERLQVQQALAQWLRQAEVQARQLGVSEEGGRLNGRSLLAVADETVRAAGLQGSVRRIVPENGTTKVEIGGANFDDVLRWLLDLKKRYGVAVASIVVDREQQAGQVRATIALRDPQT